MTRELVLVATNDGIIVEIGRGAAPRGSMDLTGDLVIPGLIELHTDHLETHLRPRPKVHWPERSAILAFDAQIAASGITTVFDCIRAGRDDDYSPVVNEISLVIGYIMQAAAEGLLRADHRVHVRCEVTSDEVLDDTLTRPARDSSPVSTRGASTTAASRGGRPPTSKS